jgi:hypothetical protein
MHFGSVFSFIIPTNAPQQIQINGQDISALCFETHWWWCIFTETCWSNKEKQKDFTTVCTILKSINMFTETEDFTFYYFRVWVFRYLIYLLTEKLYRIALKLSTPCILAANNFFLFQLNAHTTLNTYIYHQLPPTCFGVRYTIFRETLAFLSRKLYAFCNVAIKCTSYLVFLNLQVCYNVKNHMYFILLYLKNFKNVS